MIRDLLNLIYPNLCLACNQVLQRGEYLCCTKCKIDLPITDFHNFPNNNPVALKFYGKVKITNAFSFLHFVKHGQVQKLLHHLKYKGRKEVGEFLGLWYGDILKDLQRFNFDLVVPVPMHYKKLRIRGYNQVDPFAKGLAKGLNTLWDPNTLIKVDHTQSQTKKTKLDRWKNVEEVFELNTAEEINGKHVLLVDDVITTGSTIEACAKLLLEAGAIVSVATIAHAK